MSATRKALALAFAAIPYALNLWLWPFAAGEGLPTTLAKTAMLAVATWAFTLAGLSWAATKDLRDARAMILRALLARRRAARERRLQAHVSCDAAIRDAAGDRAHAVVISMGKQWPGEASAETSRALAAAFSGWTGRHMGPVTVLVEPLPESATLRAAALAGARRHLERLPNRANGPSSSERP